MNYLVPENKIEEIEQNLLLNPKSDNPSKLTHHFSDGIYVREITMPRGYIVLGHEHTTTHLNIISKGACILADPDTGTTTDIIAPCTFESKAGVRKLLYVVEECVWSTIHITEETEINKLEEALTTHSKVYKEIEERNIDGLLGSRDSCS